MIIIIYFHKKSGNFFSDKPFFVWAKAKESIFVKKFGHTHKKNTNKNREGQLWLKPGQEEGEWGECWTAELLICSISLLVG